MWVDRGAHHEDAARAHVGGTTVLGCGLEVAAFGVAMFRGTPFRGSACRVTKEHRFGLRRIDHHAEDHVAGRTQFGEARAGLTALLHKLRNGRRAHVKDMHDMPGASQRCGHPGAHCTQANQADT